MSPSSDQTVVVAAPLEQDSVSCIRTGRAIPSCEGRHCAACQLAARVRDECVTPLPLSEVSERLHLPLAVSERVVSDGVQRGWLSVFKESEAAQHFEALLALELETLLGEAGRELLTQAQTMTRRKPAASAHDYFAELLIALELSVAAAFEAADLQPLLSRFHTRLQQL